MRVRASLRRVCSSCKLVKRGRTVFVTCAANARHKQRQKTFSTLAGPALGSPDHPGAEVVTSLAVNSFSLAHSRPFPLLCGTAANAGVDVAGVHLALPMQLEGSLLPTLLDDDL